MSDGTFANGFDGKGGGIVVVVVEIAGLAIDDEPPKINGDAVETADNAGGGAPKTGVGDGDDDDGGEPKPNAGVVVDVPNGVIVPNDDDEPNGAVVPNGAVLPKLGAGVVEFDDVEALPAPKVNGASVVGAAAAAAEVVEGGVKLKPPNAGGAVDVVVVVIVVGAAAGAGLKPLLIVPNAGIVEVDDAVVVAVGAGLKPLLIVPNEGAIVDVGFELKALVVGADVVVVEEEV